MARPGGEAFGGLCGEEVDGGKGRGGGEGDRDFSLEQRAKEILLEGVRNGEGRSAGLGEGVEDGINDGNAAVEVEFVGVFGGAEEEGVIDGGVGFWIMEEGSGGMAEGGVIEGCGGQELEEDGAGIGTGEGDDGDGAHAAAGELEEGGVHGGEFIRLRDKRVLGGGGGCRARRPFGKRGRGLHGLGG